MKFIRTIYKVIRGILFTAIIFVAVVYLALYVLLSVPAFQDKVKDVAQKEASKFLASDVRIGNVIIKPFNEVVVKELEVFDRSGYRCLAVETVGAGISLWTLLKDGTIELTYGEIIGLDARISQSAPDAPLNIAFIIDAFKPKEKNKPPTKFDLNLRNVVIRRSAVAYDREWMPRTDRLGKTDFNHMRLWDVKADLNLPRLTNDDFTIDMRRLSFKLSGGLDVEKLSLRTHITPDSLSIVNLTLKLPSTELRPSDIYLKYDGFGNIGKALSEGSHRLAIEDNPVSMADFSWLLPDLARYPQPLTLNLDVRGNLNTVEMAMLGLETEDNTLSLFVRGEAENLKEKEHLSVMAEDVKIKLSKDLVADVVDRLPGVSAKVRNIIDKVGTIDLSATGKGVPYRGDINADCRLSTSCGDVLLSANAVGLKGGRGNIYTEVTIEDLALGALTGDTRVGNVTGDVIFDGSLLGKDIEGDLSVVLEEVGYRGYTLTDINAHASKEGKEVKLNLSSDNIMADLVLDADVNMDGEESWASLHSDVRSFNPDVVTALPEKYRGYTLSGRIDADLAGNSLDNVLGDLRLNDMSFRHPQKKSLMLDHLLVKCDKDSIGRMISLRSDWLTGDVKGDFKMKELVAESKHMLSRVLPCLVKSPEGAENLNSDISFDFTLAADNTLPEFFNLPFRMLVPVPVSGAIDATSNTATLHVDVPYLQQGKNKLLRSTHLNAAIDAESGTLNLTAGSIMPVKRGELKVDLQVFGQDNNVFTDVAWGMPDNRSFDGKLSLGAALSRNELTSKPEVEVEVRPSVFDFGSARWNIDPATVAYRDNMVDVDGLKIWHDSQFVKIDGVASASPLDSITVQLASIDVGYIFDVLNINYVTFGGTATGEVTALGALSREPIAATDNLHIAGLSYNGALLGDAEVRSKWNNDAKMVSISADIMGDLGHRTTADGGIWVTRDSLSFDIDANKVNVKFLEPFMAAFASDINGRASGRAKLFGSFSDIDLVGRVKADSIGLKLDFTNVSYHGSDSVYLDPGKIIVPSFILYDRDGNSAILSGELTHRYFHDPQFTFRVSDVRHMLCYDTNAQINPDWYGTLYGTGNAVVRGRPGLVGVSVDMSLVGKSTFTFVLNDTQAAEDYKFLTFSDRRKEEAEKLRTDTVEDILSKFRKQVAKPDDTPSKFQMDVRASVTPSTLMTLVMDPIAGDKITARGNGNIQVDYDTESDEMQMFGKYILEEGNYNFSLQDLILRDFSIRQGSSVAFNGDPLNAMLDIVASYRVNTNLTDLDKSFSTDRDLARTNVPVDAMLMVEGPMQQPEISFDIELPTLTQDVERKVKSIISTDDMMSRQIIYLLALNRFSTPEYMGASSNGGELASVASSTLSSQLSNMLGQLTDKFSVSPSFRSDKGDFSDLEVDVALTSRLLNNRLLINGNFGYRDRATSQTTFVGDFDIEYLLRRGGNLRLKAYNHFNDQNYYLRQALTTQGLGVIYRKEFDNPFSFLRKKKKESKDKSVTDAHHEHSDDDPHGEESIKKLTEEEE